MTPLNLEDSLVIFAEHVIGDVLLKTSLKDEAGKSMFGPPLVTAGFIPSFLTGEEDTHVIPHVVIQCNAGDYTFPKSTLTVEILISTLDSELDHQGYRDGLSIAEKLKTALFTERILGRVWAIVPPLNFRVIHVEQHATRALEHPIYRVVMTATFECASVTSRFDEIIHGSTGAGSRYPGQHPDYTMVIPPKPSRPEPK